MNDIQPIALPGVDPRRPLVIAGPCSAETEEQVIETARLLAAEGFRIYRAGLWKPRTKPGGFEGVGAAGIPWLQRVRRETGMYVSTEVATREHVAAALAGGIDLLWIGARTAANPFAMQEIADALRGQDIPMWAIPIELHRRLPSLPIFCDPSHIGGKRELIAPLSQQAMDLGFGGLIVEAHCSPDCAWSDKAQQVTPEALAYIVRNLTIREQTSTKSGSTRKSTTCPSCRRSATRSCSHAAPHRPSRWVWTANSCAR